MKLSLGLLRLLFVLGAVLAVTGPARAVEKPIHLSGGTVTVIDGDTFQVGDIVIQLSGIDAPELGQVCENDGGHGPCGMIAAYELRKLLLFEKREVDCYPLGEKDGAIIASCTYGDNDLSRTLLLDGNAAALADAPQPYVNAAHKAKSASLGIWRGEFIHPSEWRAGKRLRKEPAFDQSHEMRSGTPWKWSGVPLMPEHQPLHSACLIKGNRLAGGQGVYLSPLDSGYEDVEIDLAKGDRFFCSDDEARHAGWRRPGEKATGK